MRPMVAAVVVAVVLAGCGDDTGGAPATTVVAVPSSPVVATTAAGLPAVVASGPVYGNPDEASRVWVEQSYEDCGLMAVATIVGLVTGKAPDEQAMIEVASSTPKQDGSGPIFVPPQPGEDSTGNGTTSADQLRLLKHFGVVATATDDDIAATGGIPTGLEALQQYLGAGRKAIVGVNAETIWGEDGDHTEDDHSVVVGAIDTDQRIVYLSDSGTDGGAGEQVTIDTFETAWATGGHDLIVTNAPA